MSRDVIPPNALIKILLRLPKLIQLSTGTIALPCKASFLSNCIIKSKQPNVQLGTYHGVVIEQKSIYEHYLHGGEIQARFLDFSTWALKLAWCEKL
jgi:hypothetical protein